MLNDFLSRLDDLRAGSLLFFFFIHHFLLFQNPLSKATSQLPESACFQITIMLSLAHKIQIEKLPGQQQGARCYSSDMIRGTLLSAASDLDRQAGATG